MMTKQLNFRNSLYEIGNVLGQEDIDKFKTDFRKEVGSKKAHKLILEEIGKAADGAETILHVGGYKFLRLSYSSILKRRWRVIKTP